MGKEGGWGETGNVMAFGRKKRVSTEGRGRPKTRAESGGRSADDLRGAFLLGHKQGTFKGKIGEGLNQDKKVGGKWDFVELWATTEQRRIITEIRASFCTSRGGGEQKSVNLAKLWRVKKTNFRRGE